MSITTYLDSLASKLVLKGSEKDKIKISIDTIQSRLTNYFDNVEENFCFGSYTRGTILPRKADDNSDIDYIIVFKNENNYKPQTFLNRLKKFAEYYYSSSEIHQSYPTVVLILNHIKFELVPAYNAGTILKDYKIPAPSNIYNEWISTDPNGFNNKLINKNKNNNYKIKPLIRLIKYWNALNGKIYFSYSLEKHIIENYFFTLNNSITDYFVEYVRSFPSSNTLSENNKKKIEKMKRITNEAIQFEKSGYSNSSENKIKELLPDID